MKTHFALQDIKPLVGIAALILRHGAIVVGLAYLRAALGSRNHPPNAGGCSVSDHMRRDIGLGLSVDTRRGRDRFRHGGIE